MAELLKGAPVAKAITAQLTQQVEALKEKGVIPTLSIVRVGERPDDISYEKGAMKRCDMCGIAVKNHILPADATEEELLTVIEGINQDPTIHGVLLFRPLPKHINENRVCAALAPE